MSFRLVPKSNMCAKHYENPRMLSQVTAKNSGDIFLRHSVY